MRAVNGTGRLAEREWQPVERFGTAKRALTEAVDARQPRPRLRGSREVPW
jgi:hypothetical protein